MKTIYKYEIPMAPGFTLDLPINAEILCVQEDQKTGDPCIWAMIDTTAHKAERFFEMFATGHEIHVDMGVERRYIGTVQVENGEFVGHLFERL